MLVSNVLHLDFAVTAAVNDSINKEASEIIDDSLTILTDLSFLCLLHIQNMTLPFYNETR